MLDTAFTLKRTRQATLAELNRLFQKRLPGLPAEQLTESNCDIWFESLTAAELKRCNPGHEDALPRQMTGPVVVFEREDSRYMFDGTNRLNVWLRDGDTDHHDVTVLKKKAIAE